MVEGSEKECVKRRGSAAVSLLYIFLTVLIAVSIFLAAGAFLNTPFPLLVVKSGSMRPLIEVGDIIVVSGIDYDDIHASPTEGDVIIFYRPSAGGERALIVHRAIGITEDGVLTKGDANQFPDPWAPVPPENIVGRWTGIKIPYWTGLGYLSLILRGEIMRPLGYLIIFLIVLINAVYILKEFPSRGAKQKR